MIPNKKKQFAVKKPLPTLHYKSLPNSNTLDITFVSSKVIQKNIYVTTETYDVTMPWLGRVAVHKYAK